MPRKGRGGARQGEIGTAYGSRTDLNQPISTVPNQEYGMATAQREAQRVVPMGASPVNASPAQPQAAQPMDAMQGKPLPRPSEMPFLEPAKMPNMPITSGLPFGPGPGPQTAPQMSLSSKFSNLMAQGNSSSGLMELAAAAKNLGI